MKRFACTLLLLIFINSISAQKLCSEDSVMFLIGNWKYGKSDNMVKDKNLPFIVSRIDETRKLFQYAYPELRGTTGEWFRNMAGYPLIEGGPVPYSFNSVFQYWYCNKNSNSLLLSGETSNWGYVQFNSLSGFFFEQSDTLKVKVDNSVIYILPNPTGEWKGHPLYDFSEKYSGFTTILLTHNNKKPWKAISQKEYLQAVISDWKNEKKKNTDANNKVIEERKKTIKETQDNKNYPSSMKADLIKSLEEDLELWIKNRPDQEKQLNKFYDDKIAIAENYIKNNPAELEKPAVVDRNSDMINNFSGQFGQIGNGGQYLVIIDPTYFNKKLPVYAPQLMVLTWRWEHNVAGYYYNKQMMENFPIEKLVEMLDK